LLTSVSLAGVAHGLKERGRWVSELIATERSTATTTATNATTTATTAPTTGATASTSNLTT